MASKFDPGDEIDMLADEMDKLMDETELDETDLNVDETELDVDETDLNVDETDVDETDLDVDETDLDVDETDLDVDETDLDVDETTLGVDETSILGADELIHTFFYLDFATLQKRATLVCKKWLTTIRLSSKLSKQFRISTRTQTGFLYGIPMQIFANWPKLQTIMIDLRKLRQLDNIGIRDMMGLGSLKNLQKIHIAGINTHAKVSNINPGYLESFSERRSIEWRSETDR